MERASANLWRKIGQRYTLTGNECKNCGSSYFPARLVCRNCGRKTEMAEKTFKGDGAVYSFTRVYTPPSGFEDDAPYTIGLVKLDDGPIIEGRVLENGKSLKIGTRVHMVFRRMRADGDEGTIHYHYKFEPE